MAEEEIEREEESGAPEFFRYQLDASGQARLDLRLQGISDLDVVAVDGSARWVSIGPSRLVIDQDQVHQGIGPNAGVVADIAIDASGATDDTIYIAAGYGGVWRRGGGLDWLPTMDQLPNLAINAIALEPGNSSVLYAGVGTMYNIAAYRVHFAAIGLYKSTDGGQTWFVADGGANATTFDHLDVNDIVCPQVGLVFVATSGGLYYSVDGGLNFGGNHPAYNDGNAVPFVNQFVPVADASVTSLALDTTSPTTIVWAALSGEGIFRVTINADNSLTLSSNLFFGPGTPVPGTFSDIQFGQGRGTTGTPRPDQTLYASVQFTNPAANFAASFVGLYKSIDAGATWHVSPAAGLPARLGTTGASQSAYDFAFGVDPQDGNRIYAGFIELWRSADAAGTFPETTSCGAGKIHWDQHVIAFSPPAHWGASPSPPTTIYVGNDGGLARSTNGGTTWQSQNDGAATILFYGIDIGRGSAANNAYTYGGAQDTGTQGRRPGDIGSEWHSGFNGDGGHVAVDTADPRIVYGFSNNLLIKTVDAGAHWLIAAEPKVANISGATNASPIVITATAHGFNTGDLVSIAGVGGNTNANDIWVVTVITPNTFSLFGSTGNAPYTAGGTATRMPRGDLAISGATNASPIVITTAWHPFQTGDRVSISNVGGNTAANGHFTVTRVSDTQFSLNGSSGNGAYTSGGTVIGPGIGRGLQAPGGEFQLRRIGLVANGANPATTVYVSELAQLYRSTDQGINFAPMTAIPAGVGDTTITALCVFDANHLWVGLANGSVHFSADGGTTWDAGTFNSRPGPVRWVSAIAVDAANVQRAAVTFSGYAEISPKFRTGNCYLTTTGGASWSDVSGTDGNVSGNLPDLPLHDVVFDSSTTPSTMIVSTDGGVLTSTDSGAHWQRLGVDLPRVSCLSLAIDNTVTPRVLRVGTFGRGAFELMRPVTASIVVESNLAFGAVPTGTTRSLVVTVRNAGNSALTINDFRRVTGDADFALQAPPAFPVSVPAHGSQQFTIAFAPTTGGVRSAGFVVDNSDASASLLPVFASGQGMTTAGSPRLAVRAHLLFGQTTDSAPRELPLEIANNGLGPLSITAISRTGGSDDFALVGAPAFPLNLAPGASQSITVRFKPGGSGPLSAEFTIVSNDPRTPQRKVNASGIGVTAGSDTLKIVLIILGVAVLAVGAGAGIAYLASKK